MPELQSFNRSIIRLMVCAAALVAGACLSDATGAPDHADDPSRPNRLSVPDEVYDENGNLFVYVGPGATDDNRALLDSLLHDPAPVGSELEVLAHNLRSHSNRQGHYYVQAEPAFELAERILSGPEPEPTRSGLPLEARDTNGADNRARVTLLAYPQSTATFNEIGCSGRMIGRNTMVTAAHCLFDTRTSNAFLCSNGLPAPCTGGATVNPRLRGGVNGTAGLTAWANCYNRAVPQGFVALTSSSSGTNFAKFDYAVVDFTGGGACSNPTMDDGGWLGTASQSNAVIASQWTYRSGYPAFATCSANVDGRIASECPAPAGAWRYSGAAESNPPFTSAQLWGSSSGPGATVAASTNGADVLVSTLDWTPGDSGSAIFVGSESPTFYVIGMVSNSASPTTNFAARWTSTVHNFVDANAPFPADTM